MLLLKVTSRGRRAKLIDCITKYRNMAANPTRMIWLFTFDTDDTEYNDQGFLNQIKSLVNDPIICFGASRNKIDAINRDINNSFVPEWDILVNISDDQMPIVHGWDILIRNNMPNDLDSSLWFWDSWQKRINTMEIVGRNYYNRTNCVYHPSYKSFYCDNEATDIAKRLGKLIYIDQCIIKHFHPAAMPTELRSDKLYDRNQMYWDEDKRNYERRKLLNFGG